MAGRDICDQAGADGETGFVLPAGASERLRLAADREAMPGTAGGAGLFDEFFKLGRGSGDGVLGAFQHRAHGLSPVRNRIVAGSGERCFRIVYFQESFAAGLVHFFRGRAELLNQELTHDSMTKLLLLEICVETLAAAILFIAEKNLHKWLAT